MKRNVLAALLIGPMVLIAAHAIGQSPTLDQQQGVINSGAGVTFAIGGGPERQRLAQVVTAGLTGSLTQIGLAAGCAGLDRLTVEIQGVSFGKPNNVVLSSNTSSIGASVPPPTFKSVTLGSPVAFHAGDQFAIVLSTPSATDACSTDPGPIGNPYAGGDAFVNSLSDPPGQWTAISAGASSIYGADLPFQTFVAVANAQPVAVINACVSLDGDIRIIGPNQLGVNLPGCTPFYERLLSLQAASAPVFFANVSQAGAIVDSSPGVTAIRTDPGRYEVTFPVDVSKCAPVATLGLTTTGGQRPTAGGQTQVDQNVGTPNVVSVQTFNGSGTLTSSSFHLIVAC